MENLQFTLQRNAVKEEITQVSILNKCIEMLNGERRMAKAKATEPTIEEKRNHEITL